MHARSDSGVRSMYARAKYSLDSKHRRILSCAKAIKLKNSVFHQVRSAASLRKHFDVTQKTFALILLGKDGGIKLKRNDRVKLDEIFTLIDSMPMRKDEMRQKGQSF